MVDVMDPTEVRGHVAKDVVHLLFEFTGRLRALMDRVAGELDLSPMQARALFMTREPVPMGFLAEALHCDASNITGIVDRLEDRALMSRVTDPDDRRRKNLVVTPEGRVVTERLQELLHEGNPILDLADAELEVLHGLLLQLLGPTEPPCRARTVASRGQPVL